MFDQTASIRNKATEAYLYRKNLSEMYTSDRQQEIEEKKESLQESYQLALECCMAILRDHDHLLSYLEMCETTGMDPNDSHLLIEKHLYAKAMQAVGYKIKYIADEPGT